jgi:starch synthase
MRIVQVAAEFAPIAKAGGLGEVLLGLSRELTRQYHQVEVLLPKYSFIDLKSLSQLKIDTPDLRVEEQGQSISNTVWSASLSECQLKLFEARHPAGYFHRKEIYGHPDDLARFLYFSRMVMEYLKNKNEPIDILHIHEWHAAPCALFAKKLFASSLKIGAVLLTIHNLEYQGQCDISDLAAVGLLGQEEGLQDPDPRYPKTLNLLKGGILHADAVNTVSPSYHKEILTLAKGGGGLGTLLKNKSHFSGILNGIDKEVWNPATDLQLPVRYSESDSLLKIREAKAASKKLIQKNFQKNWEGRPLIGAINRLVPQKGIDLLPGVIEQSLSQGAAFSLLGSSPIPEIQKTFDLLKEKYKDHPHVLLQYEYTEELAHQLFAACDFILVPSLFEPCGLTQLFALRYGTIPIVHSTGGLKDTVFDCENGLIPREKRNGFVFLEPTPKALHAALTRALALFRTDEATHDAMIQRGMRSDFSWEKPTKEYVRLYRKLLEN